jgi:phosphoserine aminotransferase
MELSHRQDEFRYISIMSKREVRKFLRVPDNYVIMFQQGGATMQYTAIVKNLIGLKPQKKCMLMRQGMWSNQCLAEVKKHAKEVVIVCDLITDNDCTAMVPYDKWKIDPEASLFCVCTNETVNGLEIDLKTFPWHKIPKDIPICMDMSSNIGTCDVPWENGQIGVVYMGA